MKRRIFGLIGRTDDTDGDADHVSTACRRHLLRHASTRGVDSPTWRLPHELKAMREAEMRERRTHDATVTDAGAVGRKPASARQADLGHLG